MARNKAFAIIVAVLLIVGCGGSGGTGITNSPFAGSYAGTWDSPATGQSGTAAISIATNGRVTGSTTITSGGSGTGSVTGVIQNTGQISGSIQYPGEPKSTFSGTLSADPNGNLTGVLIQRINGVDYPVTFALTKL